MPIYIVQICNYPIINYFHTIITSISFVNLNIHNYEDWLAAIVCVVTKHVRFVYDNIHNVICSIIYYLTHPLKIYINIRGFIFSSEKIIMYGYK